MATSAVRTALNAELLARGLTNASGVVTGSLTRGQVEELCAVVESKGVDVTHLSPTDTTAADSFVLAPVASNTNTITVRSLVGPGTMTVQIGDNASDALAVTYTTGAIFIKLANVTDSNNTLTLIKAAIDALNTSTNGNVVACFITGTASTQMVHGGTNTVAATAAGGTAAGGLKSSLAALGAFSIKPV